MHLPDGFLDAKTALLSTGAAATGVSIALRTARASLQPRQVPMLGLGAAFVFAAQMLNFPVAGGTSGHLIGGVLIAILLGPSAAILVLTCVLLVQCLMFADGGLMALGANIFNMAILSACGGYFVFRLTKNLIRMDDSRSTVFAAAFAAWFGTVLASISCAGELALSKAAPWNIAFPAMANVHMLIGVGEGLATALIVRVVLQARPELLASVGKKEGFGHSGFLGYGLLIAVGMALFVAPFACPWPDGLQSFAQAFGLQEKVPASFAAPLAEYHLPFVGSATIATGVAGLIGTLMAFVAAYALARMLVPVLGAAKKDAPSGN
jgi:cobalt/nickel transport system permease protein